MSTSSPHPSEREPVSSSESSGSSTDQEDLLVSQRIRNGIAIVITGVWAAGIIADALSSAFELSPFVYATMMGLATAIFGSNFVKGLKE